MLRGSDQANKMNTIIISKIDTSCYNKILDSNDNIFGIIYEMTNNRTGMKYVGQTVSHRKNKAKYRPFGETGRFKDHISEAVNNTKKKQCSYLNHAIRKYGSDAFSVTTLETCTLSALNEREQYYIKEKNTLFPNGYNLTKGGKTAHEASYLDSSELKSPKKRGGCIMRSEETRAKMKARAKELVNDEFRTVKSARGKTQHNAAKIERFKDCKVDLSMIESYISTKGKRVVVIIDVARAEFTSKHETIEQVKERAKTFIKELHNATLSNCGEPVKHE
jgi:group I intron endonuclease